MWIHPKLDKGIGKAHPDLTKIEQAFGFWIFEKDYQKFRDEANIAVPHLTDEEKRVWAIYNAQRHPSCSKRSSPKQSVSSAMSPVIYGTNWTLIIQIAILVLLVVMFATRGHSQDKPDSPVTVVPLEDSAKVKFLLLLRKQDDAIEKKQAAQLQIDALDKEIQKLQEEVNQEAQKLATDTKIDTTTLVLDLDRLAWITKGIK